MHNVWHFSLITNEEIKNSVYKTKLWSNIRYTQLTYSYTWKHAHICTQPQLHIHTLYPHHVAKFNFYECITCQKQIFFVDVFAKNSSNNFLHTATTTTTTATASAAASVAAADRIKQEKKWIDVSEWKYKNKETSTQQTTLIWEEL